MRSDWIRFDSLIDRQRDGSIQTARWIDSSILLWTTARQLHFCLSNRWERSEPKPGVVSSMKCVGMLRLNDRDGWVVFGGCPPARVAVAGSTVATVNQAGAIIIVDQNFQLPSCLTRLFLVDHQFLVIIDHAFSKLG